MHARAIRKIRVMSAVIANKERKVVGEEERRTDGIIILLSLSRHQTSPEQKSSYLNKFKQNTSTQCNSFELTTSMTRCLKQRVYSFPVKWIYSQCLTNYWESRTPYMIRESVSNERTNEANSRTLDRTNSGIASAGRKAPAEQAGERREGREGFLIE